MQITQLIRWKNTSIFIDILLNRLIPDTVYDKFGLSNGYAFQMAVRI